MPRMGDIQYKKMNKNVKAETVIVWGGKVKTQWDMKCPSINFSLMIRVSSIMHADPIGILCYGNAALWDCNVEGPACTGDLGIHEMDQCCAPNRTNALCTQWLTKHINDHPTKRHFHLESGIAFTRLINSIFSDRGCCFSSNSSQARPKFNTFVVDPYDPCNQKTEAWEFRQRSSPAQGVRNRDLSAQSWNFKTSSHGPKLMCCNSCGLCGGLTSYKIGTSWMGISCELIRQSKNGWPWTSTCRMCKHAFSSTTCGSEENHLKIDINNTTWSKSVSSTKHITV